MRRAANFNPEWGYLAPAPSFVRSARLVIVATVIGATAGAAVVFSLVDRPAAEESVAARTLVPHGAVAASAVAGAPVIAQWPTESQQAQSRADTQGVALAPAHAGSAASELGTTSTAQRPSSALALAEAPTVTNAPPTQETSELTAAEPAPTQKTPAKKPRVTWRTAPRYGAPRYDQRYVQTERESFGWQRPFAERAY